MYSLPFLPLKALRWHFFQFYTFSKDSRRKCKVGENAVLELSKPELVRNACFYIELVSVTYASIELESLKSMSVNVREGNFDDEVRVAWILVRTSTEPQGGQNEDQREH